MGERAFAQGLGYLQIEAVEIVQLGKLTDADARADGFENVRALKKVLAEFYPDAKGNRDGRKWFRVRFTFIGKVAQRERAAKLRGKSAKAQATRRTSRTSGAVKRASTKRGAMKCANVAPMSVSAQRRALADHLRVPAKMSSR